MKKLMAWLLALMLPAACYAEAWVFDASISVKTGFEQYITQMLLDNGVFADESAKGLASAYAQLVDGLGFTVTTQEDAATLQIQMCGGTLLDMNVYSEEDALYMTSSLVPGYALMQTADQPTDARDAVTKQFETFNWDEYVADVAQAAGDWVSALESATTRGIFEGDAYTGGQNCKTITLTDADIADLAARLLTPEIRELLHVYLTALNLEAEAVLSQLNDVNEQVAAEDAYLYLLRLVTDVNDRLVGISLSIEDDYQQLVTLSLGLNDQNIVMVLGIGASPEQNYWCEATVSAAQQKSVTKLQGTIKEWTGDKREAFSYVKASRSAERAWSWNVNLIEMGSRILWNGDLSDEQHGWTITHSGDVNTATGAMKMQVASDIVLNLSVQRTEALIAPMDETVTVCSVTDPQDAELYAQVMKRVEAALMARVLKLLPVEVLITLMDFGL